MLAGERDYLVALAVAVFAVGSVRDEHGVRIRTLQQGRKFYQRRADFYVISDSAEHRQSVADIRSKMKHFGGHVTTPRLAIHK